VIAVIPARFGSTRLPAKPLADIHGKPMVQWVYERAKAARGVDRVLVATDDERIAQAVKKFNGEYVMTSPDIASGTDRMAAVADQVKGGIFINVQGDGPMMSPIAIEKATELVRSGRFPLGTAMTPITSHEDLRNPNVVKVIADRNDRAIYFSRHPIPYSRGPEPGPGEPFACMRHVGLYVYERETLFKFRSLPPSRIEKAEVLEQLRALENGIPIGIVEVNFVSIEVDTQEDLDKVRSVLV
jgi:3-deoxy-manno-octulosonate cytidylyltransferase (CMP-KDO synthetase)